MFGRRFARRFFGGPYGPGPWGPGPGPWGGGPGNWGGPGPENWGPGPGRHEHWRGQRWFSPEQLALRSTAAEVARLFMIAGRSAADNPERQAQLRSFLERSRKELSDMIYSAGESAAAPEEPTSGTPKA